MTTEQICATTSLAKQTALHFAVQRKDAKMVEILARNPIVKKKLVNRPSEKAHRKASNGVIVRTSQKIKGL